jgi:hypothetical protein
MNSFEKYSPPPSDLRHLMLTPFSFSNIALNSKNVETLHLCVSWSRPTPSLCGHQWNWHNTCILQWILFSWSTHLSGSFPKVWNIHELFELGMDALLEILSFATSHYATSMQLVVVCNYLGHICNYKFSIV